ncbi:unnamed protein product, partial [Polarella glacialis]
MLRGCCCCCYCCCCCCCCGCLFLLLLFFPPQVLGCRCCSFHLRGGGLGLGVTMSALRKFFTDEITPNFSSISPRCAHLIPPGFRENSLAHNAIERINSDVDTRFAERQEWKS